MKNFEIVGSGEPFSQYLWHIKTTVVRLMDVYNNGEFRNKATVANTLLESLESLMVAHRMDVDAKLAMIEICRDIHGVRAALADHPSLSYVDMLSEYSIGLNLLKSIVDKKQEIKMEAGKTIAMLRAWRLANISFETGVKTQAIFSRTCEMGRGSAKATSQDTKTRREKDEKNEKNEKLLLLLSQRPTWWQIPCEGNSSDPRTVQEGAIAYLFNMIFLSEEHSFAQLIIPSLASPIRVAFFPPSFIYT